MLVDGLLTSAEFDQLTKKFMTDLLQEAAGFCACSMARRTLGIAGVADIRDIEDVDRRSTLEIANLELSKEIMAARHDLATIADWTSLVREFYNQRDL